MSKASDILDSFEYNEEEITEAFSKIKKYFDLLKREIIGLKEKGMPIPKIQTELVKMGFAKPLVRYFINQVLLAVD